jgi:anaerobic ribonucleoside-triphosphate reductase activating protein
VFVILNNEIRLAGIVKESVVDGLGVRMSLFGSGCVHKCYNCQNKELWDHSFGALYNIGDVLDQISKNPIIDGITCSGGDPFEQANSFGLLCSEVKRVGLNVWTYTGYTYEYILENLDIKNGWRSLLENTDVLVDGPYVDAKRDLSIAFRGSSNQRLIDVQKSLLAGKVIALEI